MGQSLPLIVVILIIAIVVLVIERRWRRSAEKEATSTASEAETQTGYVSKVTDSFKGLRDRIIPGKQPELAKEFQTWAGEALTDRPALKEWLTAFSPEASQNFTDQLAAFCADLNLDLGWLVQKKLDKDPDIEQAAKEVVVDYCQACYQAAQAQLDFKAFGVFQAMIQNPRGHRDLSKKLFTQLVNQKAAEPITPDLFLAPEDERQAHMMKAITDAAEKDRQKFITIFKQVLADEEAEDDAKSESWLAKIARPFKKSKPVVAEAPESTTTAATT